MRKQLSDHRYSFGFALVWRLSHYMFTVRYENIIFRLKLLAS